MITLGMIEIGGLLRIPQSSILGLYAITAPEYAERAIGALLEAIPLEAADRVRQLLWEDVWGTIGELHRQRMAAIAEGRPDPLTGLQAVLDSMHEARFRDAN